MTSSKTPSSAQLWVSSNGSFKICAKACLTLSPEFETPCVRYGELYHMYNEVIYEVVNNGEDNEVAVYNDRGIVKYYRPNRFELLSEYRINIIDDILDEN